jgi:hypothetical protein
LVLSSENRKEVGERGVLEIGHTQWILPLFLLFVVASEGSSYHHLTPSQIKMVEQAV